MNNILSLIIAFVVLEVLSFIVIPPQLRLIVVVLIGVVAAILAYKILKIKFKYGRLFGLLVGSLVLAGLVQNNLM
jgi:hypothetical protein